ncbi:MAG: hypothetical protein KC503_00225 [Myxococcales bacterium]|nr:hypothetical protein [Myxococcales bacterium]
MFDHRPQCRDFGGLVDVLTRHIGKLALELGHAGVGSGEVVSVHDD